MIAAFNGTSSDRNTTMSNKKLNRITMPMNTGSR
jgi:hypothetical protein